MFFKNKPLFFLVAALAFSTVALVRAQSGSETATSASASGTAGIDPCVLDCVQTAASSAGCSDVQDLTCICSSSSFQSAALSCLQQNCPSSIPEAQALQSQECAAVSAASSATSGAASGTVTGTSAGSSTLSSTTSHTASASGSGTSSASRSSSALSKSDVGLGGVLSVAVGFLGIVLGALVL